MRRIPVEANQSVGEAVWIEVDPDALAHNVRTLRGGLANGCALIGVVKANAYGHGAVPVARALRANGVAVLAVGSVLEGVELRAAGIECEILVVGPCLPEHAEAAIAARLVPTLSTVSQLDAFAASAREVVGCHVEIDTGMRRHGVAPEAFPDFVRALRARGRLRLVGAFTHFAGLQAGDLPAMRRQLDLFLAPLARVRDLGPVRRHACNSLATVLLPDAHLDAVRIGGGLYGFDVGDRQLGLRPVLSLRARCVGLRDAAPGDRVGYGGHHVCERPARLALLPIGYADGLASELWRSAEVLVRGARAPIVGRISMNQTIVDVTAVPGVELGCVFTLIGRSGGACIEAGERAAAAGSAYEVTSLLGRHLPRREVASRGIDAHHASRGRSTDRL